MRWLVVVALAGCGSARDAEPCTVEDIDGAAVITCPDGTTVRIEDGAAGVDGQDGSDGTNGVDGSNGIDNHIIANIRCTGLLQSTTIYFTYESSVMASGDVWAKGSIYNGAFEVGASTFYAGGQVGAGTAAVLFQADVAGTSNGGYWLMSLDRTTVVTTIVYTDNEVSDGSDSWTMQPSACVVNTY